MDNIQNEIEQLIIGSMLGDGYLSKQPENKYNSRLSIAHSIKQKEYIEWKWKILDNFNLAGKLCYNKIYNDRYIKGYMEEYRFRSKANSLFTFYRNIFYPNGKKVLDFSMISKINELGLTIWLLDDMHLCTTSYQINTQCFSLTEIEKLREILKEKFNINTTHQKFDNVIYVRKNSLEILNNLILPYTVESMKYKLHLGSV